VWKRNSLIFLMTAATLAAGDLERFEAVEPHMGTLFGITLYARDAAQAQAGFKAAFTRIAQLDATLSDYKEDSELMQVCRSAHQKPIRVSADLFTILTASQQLAQQTNGAFDVTLGPVTRLWREARRSRHIPDPESIEAAAQRTGFHKLVLDPRARTVFLDSPGMLLDLGAIAKGYAADEALRVLREYGIRQALVAASGDLAIGDAPPGKRGWRVGVAAQRILELHNAAVSTSGDAEQFLEIGGVRYSHIIDPKTNMGLTKGITVTVVARHGIDSDSLATASSVLGVERGLALIAAHPGTAALFVTEAGERRSPKFAYFEAPEAAFLLSGRPVWTPVN
jgi:FAD:protein FMN transferase